ncbi:MAG: tetratricopeptide repeat protein [Candidatus Sericytochromatia bacterium]|nr:tetratricopeptide repeat protein [Candidatus Sericytochromatia bacterium]
MSLHEHPLFRQGVTLLDRERHEDALELFTELLAVAGGDPVVHLHRGKARGALGDLVGAGEDYGVAIAAGAEEVAYEARLRRGLIRTEQLALEEAVADFSVAAASCARRLAPFHHRGWARYLLGDMQGAVEDYTEVLRRRPDHVATWFLRGRARLDQEDFDGAMADFLVALVLQPEHPEAGFQFQIAAEVAARREREPDEAGEEAPEDWAGFLARGEARRHAGEWLGAMADYFGALRHRINCPQARLGVALAREGLLQEASARVAAERLEQVPGDIRAFVRRADALRRLGRPEDACAVLLAARRVDPGDPEVHAELGLTLACWLGDPAGALPHFDEALRHEPNHIEARRHRAIARRGLGRVAEAIQDFDILEQLIPGDRTLYLNRGLAHEALGDWAGAERDYGLGLRVTPANERLLWKRACARLALGRQEEARADFERAIALQPALAALLADDAAPAGEAHRADLAAALVAFARLRPEVVADQMAEFGPLLRPAS